MNTVTNSNKNSKIDRKPSPNQKQIIKYNIMEALVLEDIATTDEATLFASEKKECSLPKKRTLWDVALELEKKPLIRVLDEDLVYGTNMWTKLMQEEKL